MAVLCLPPDIDGLDLRAALAAGPLPGGPELVWWDGTGEPDRAGEIEALVLPFGAPLDVLARMPRLRMVQTLSAGVDRILPAVPEGVILCDGRGTHGSSVAEWVLAALLAVVRELPRFVRLQGAGTWENVQTGELAGATVLIVGAGDIGLRIARLVEAFGAEPVLVARRARDGVHGIGDLPRLLPGADAVVLVVPLTAETTGLADAAFLAAMRDGAILVNAARGPVVDTDALLAELTSGRLRAALDVTEPEPLPEGHPLWQAPGLLLTPHVAGYVTGFPPRALALIRPQLERFLRGEPLENVVEDGY
jgi:phosphoglycerate dehydrogenase-like enzyme